MPPADWTQRVAQSFLPSVAVAAVAYFHRLLAPHGPNVIRLMERKLPKGTDLSVYS